MIWPKPTTGLLLAAVALFLSTAPACRKDYPPRHAVVSRVDVESDVPLDTDSILQGLATSASPRFLGIWDGVVFEYSVYDPELLARDLERIQRYLKARGYYEAHVVAARVVPMDEHRVRVHVRVVVGVPVLVRSVSFTGLEQVPIEVSSEALQTNLLVSGKPFDERNYEQTKQEVRRVLRNEGYAFAKVEGRVRVDIPTHGADVEIAVDPGPESVLGNVTVLGLRGIPEDRVRASLGLARGEKYSQARLDDARRALVSLGVFSSVRVIPEIEAAEENRVPVTIVVEEAQLRTVRIGGGSQLDALQLSTHLTTGWEHRNFLGGMRRFSIDAKPGVVYFPTRLGHLNAPDRLLLQHEVRTELRQPAFIEGRTTGFISGAFNVYPLLYAETPDDEAIIGFAEVKTSTGVERKFWKHRLLLVPSYNWQLEMPLDYNQLTLGNGIAAEDAGLQDLFIAFPELLAQLDFRNDALDPRSGAFFSMGVQLANSLFGSDVSDLRLRPEARFYVPISSSVTFATRFMTGFLLPQDYGDTFADTDAAASTDPAVRNDVTQDQQKVLFRGFFSGGPNSNRGYPFRGVGPHGPVPFLSGTRCEADPSLRICNRPLGGLSVWEASAEVRFPIAGALRSAVFIDGSNVNRSTELNFSAPHLSAGLGLRYTTPIGPVRVDAGYRLPLLQDFTGQQELEPRALFGLPMALHLSLGEAF